MRFLPSALFLACLPLAALEAEPQEERPCPPSRGQVSMRMVVRQLLLERYDSDCNGNLDAGERRRLMQDAHAAREEQARAFIRRFDADGDGHLTPEERNTLKQVLEARRRQEPNADAPPLPPHPEHRHSRQGRRHHTPPPPMGKAGRMVAFMVHQLTMDAYDADRNGILDTSESARLREDGAALYASREAELLERFDTDKDGHISESELMAAREALLPKRPAPPHAAGTPLPPPPPRPHKPGAIHHLLDTHFDIDILMNLVRRGSEGDAP